MGWPKADYLVCTSALPRLVLQMHLDLSHAALCLSLGWGFAPSLGSIVRERLLRRLFLNVRGERLSP